MNIIELDYSDLVLAAAFLLLPGLLSWKRDLGIHRDLLIGAVRCFGQLMAMGYLLKYIFQLNTWPIVAAVLLAMMVAGGWEASSRHKRPVSGLFRISTVSIFLTSSITLGFVLIVVIQTDPWYDPRYAIPLAGMVVGNAMTSSALAADRLGSEMRLRQREIELLLTLGATPAQATRETVRNTIKASLIPSITAMSTTGLVKLPGLMTGQILGGASPLNAVRYQILVMYFLVFVAAMTAVMVTALAYRRYFTPQMQMIARYFVND